MSALLKEERSFINLLEGSIGVNGAREADEFVINVFLENQKTYKLNRFKYLIKAGPKFHFDFIKSEIQLPYFFNEECIFELVLVKVNLEERYLLKSLTSIPFKINGGWSFEAYIERGDIVDIGFNRLNFKKIISNNSDELLSKLPPEIIESPLSIMIEGETGTGKTTLAKKIHDRSGVIGNFVHLNLSSFAPSLIESELFGHVKGAFTGAFNNKNGAFVQANRGTLFLDEIDSLPRELQTKLLLFLENFEVRPVGAETSQKVNVRLIFASGRNLKKLVDEKYIRPDFYYRIMSGFFLKLDNLVDDKFAIKKFCDHFSKTEMVVISDELISYYEKIHWPGNIRQLKSHLMKKKIMSHGKKLILNHLDEGLLHLSDNVNTNSSFQSLDDIKYEHCLNTFFKMGKNIKRTANVLGISENTLRGILKRNEN